MKPIRRRTTNRGYVVRQPVDVRYVVGGSPSSGMVAREIRERVLFLPLETPERSDEPRVSKRLGDGSG
jgi:hypothetical protein